MVPWAAPRMSARADDADDEGEEEDNSEEETFYLDSVGDNEDPEDGAEDDRRDDCCTDTEKEDEEAGCVILGCRLMPPRFLASRASPTPLAEDMLATLPYQGGEGPCDRSRSPPRRLDSTGSAGLQQTQMRSTRRWAGGLPVAVYEEMGYARGAPEYSDAPDSHPVNLPAEPEPGPWGRGSAEWTPPRSSPEAEVTAIRCPGDEVAMFSKGGGKGLGKERSLIPVAGLRPSRQTWTSCWTTQWTHSDLSGAAPIKHDVDLCSLNWDAKGGYVTEQWEWSQDGASLGDRTEIWESSWLTKWTTVADMMQYDVDLVFIGWDHKTCFVTEKWEWTSVGVAAAVDVEEGGFQPRPEAAPGSSAASAGAPLATITWPQRLEIDVPLWQPRTLDVDGPGLARARARARAIATRDYGQS